MVTTSLIKPRALRKGNTVGIIAPSSPSFEESGIEFTYQWLQKLGLKWKTGKHIFDKYSDFAGSDEARLDDFMSMWKDPEVDAIFPMHGGSGAARLLPLIDFEFIAKLFIGYSDLTALLIPIHQRCIDKCIMFLVAIIAKLWRKLRAWLFGQQGLGWVVQF